MNNLKVAAALTLVLAVGTKLLTGPSHPTNDRDIAKTTAMITRMDGRSGGTGVVLSSKSDKSTILTNAHVCQVAKYGGMVTTDNNSAPVTSYQISEIHDLCLITVNANLGVNTEVSSNSPSKYEEAIVSGHPQLLPTIITKGTFSNKEIITIMTGMRACTKEEAESKLALICAFLGGVPVIKTYQAQVISALIQPGSSGSAVFNDRGRISALVFAGNGPLSYGHVVPQEYILNFVNNEVPNLEVKTPLDDSASLLNESGEKKLRSACKDGPTSLSYTIVKDFCEYSDLDLVQYAD